MFKFLLQTVLLLKIYADVKAQFMPQQAPPMSFPMAQMRQMPMTMGQQMAMPMGMGSPLQMGSMSMMTPPKFAMPMHKKNSKRKDKRRNKKRKRRPKKYSRLSSIESDSESRSDSEESKRRSGRRNSRSQQGNVLTPVISYVTKDGYVVYQKKIKRDKAKEWLNIGRRSKNHFGSSAEKISSSDEEKKKPKKDRRKH